MKRKSPRLLLIFCLLTMSLFIGGGARADDGGLPDPGITPDSPFYFVDIIGKHIDMFFTFGADVKAMKALDFAEERLAEARAMAAKNRLREMERAAGDYDKYMNMCSERMREVNQQSVSEIISERIALSAGRHLDILDSVIDETPEADVETLRRARLTSQDGQVNALRLLGEIKPERAIDIARSTIENRLERVSAKANDAAGVTETIDYAVRLAEMEDEITLSSRGKYASVNDIEQSLSDKNTDRDSIISDIMPEISIRGIQNGVDNSLGTYESTIEQLMERGATGNAVSEQTAVQRLRNRLGENVEITASNGQQSQTNSTDNASVQLTAQYRNEVSDK
jgi:hypothetical protein